uniref:Conotoxin Mr8.2 n=1 Tax=Conus marmoreus TaxID=42752 RepID=CB28_CONMR|nr:RecName: Full=Conotoxin Mr8.2; AltName: Full=Mr096; Flags: Precursor [Conus marmoreus]
MLRLITAAVLVSACLAYPQKKRTPPQTRPTSRALVSQCRPCPTCRECKCRECKCRECQCRIHSCLSAWDSRGIWMRT